jgi:hypothetical protein
VSFIWFIAGLDVLPWLAPLLVPPLVWAKAPPESASVATAAINVLVALIMIRSSMNGLEYRRKRLPPARFN